MGHGRLSFSRIGGIGFSNDIWILMGFPRVRIPYRMRKIKRYWIVTGFSEILDRTKLGEPGSSVNCGYALNFTYGLYLAFLELVEPHSFRLLAFHFSLIHKASSFLIAIPIFF